MAVATHVSRVSKEYAPHGYSIMERVTLTAEESTSGGPSDVTIPLVYSDDGGLWIEAVEVMWPMGYGANFAGGGVVDPDADNQWHIDLVGSTFPGAAEVSNIVHLETFNGGDPNPGVHYSVVASGTPGGPPFNGHYIPPGAFLGLRIQEKDTGAGPGSDLMVSLHVRYRAKA